MSPDTLVFAATVLIVFGGMAALVWRALSIAHDLAKLALQGGIPQAQVSAVVNRPVVPQVAKPTAGPSDAVTPGLVAFIKKQEGFSPKAYWDYKQYSIGYGTKATGPNEVIDQAEGERRLIEEIHKADKLVTDRFPNLPLGQHQALLDLTYNAGSGWEDQSLGRAVAAQKIETIKADILQYNHAGGQVNEGLTKRREAEISWFDNPI